MFDIAGTGTPIKLSWTAPGSTNAFLALPGPDGRVTNGRQLFGNFTPQPTSPTPNGFEALAVYDLPANGGNGDGVIDVHDRIFASLRLWVDANHDGIAQPDELFTLPSKGVYSISLHYHLSSYLDKYGNAFRFWSKVNPVGPSDMDSEVGPKAYDVFLVAAPK
jgi:hypothetical protein